MQSRGIEPPWPWNFSIVVVIVGLAVVLSVLSDFTLGLNDDRSGYIDEALNGLRAGAFQLVRQADAFKVVGPSS